MSKDTQRHSDRAARGAFLAAARSLMPGERGALFPLKDLYALSGFGRAAFRRCFGTRAMLLAAVTQGDAEALSGLVTAAEPVAVRRAASGDGASCTPIVHHGTDAWLERRLRVFERALAALESRQEKSERALSLQLARLQENLADQVLSQPSGAQMPVEPDPAPDPAPVAAPAPVAVTAPVEQEPVCEPAGGHVTEAEIETFRAHARRLAQKSVVTEPVPVRKFPSARWIAWSGIVLLLLLACTAFLLANGALGYAAVSSSSTDHAVLVRTGVAHRRVAQTGLARVIALADSGNARAQTRLAFAYLRGEGVPADDGAALRWSQVAAAHGDPVAQYLLGTLYLQGDGAAQDAVQAVRWFRAAAGQGNIRAMHNLGIAYVEGLGVEKDAGEAVRWFRRAAQLGYRDSAFDLAVLHERGEGVTQSARGALTWYLIAAHGGDGASAARAAVLRGQMAPAEASAAERDAAAFAPEPDATIANGMPSL